MTNRLPELNSESFECPRCNAFAHQSWKRLFLGAEDGGAIVFTDEEFSPADRYFSPAKERALQWSSSCCFSCKKHTVWRGSTVAYPPKSNPSVSPHPDMTQASAELFAEAVEVLPISRRAAAALARASMESELRALDIGSKGDRLDDRIAKLGNKVSHELWQVLTVLRDTGNKALHGTDDDHVVALLLDGADDEIAPYLLSAINEVVEELVAKPRRSAALYDALSEGVRSAAEVKKERFSSSSEPIDPGA